MEKTNKPNILITEPAEYSKEAIEIYASIGTVILGSTQREILLEQLATAHMAVIRLGMQMSAELMRQHAPQLRCIVTPTTGLNHIDTAYTTQHSIAVVSLKGESKFLEDIPSTAEFTWSLLLACTRNIIAAANDTHCGHWNRDNFIGNNLRNKTIGIVGFGRVGKQVAVYANAFGMKVKAYDIHPGLSEHSFVQSVSSIEELISTSDVVTIHIPSENNTGYLNKSLLQMSKKGAIWINTSRANVWDEVALAALVESGHIHSVATDVLNHENNTTQLTQNILWKAAQKNNRIILTPHLAGATVESMARTELFVAEKARKYWLELLSGTIIRA